jgi:hypothetical protein
VEDVEESVTDDGAELEDSTTTEDDTTLELAATSLAMEGMTTLVVGRTKSVVEEAATSLTVDEATSLGVEEAPMVSLVSATDEEDSKTAVDIVVNNQINQV